MKENAWLGVRAFSCIQKFAVLLFKFHTVAHQITDNLSGIFNHNRNRLPAVFVMPRPHRVLEIAVEIFIVPLNADASLGKKRIAAFKIGFRDEKDPLVGRQVQRTEQSGNTGSYNYNISLHVVYPHLFSCQFQHHF